jgi:hypothetical protein
MIYLQMSKIVIFNVIITPPHIGYIVEPGAIFSVTNFVKDAASLLRTILRATRLVLLQIAPTTQTDWLTSTLPR